jgi:hypothetical protein
LVDNPGLCRAGLLLDMSRDQIDAVDNDGIFLAVHSRNLSLLAAILACQDSDLVSSPNTLCHVYSTSGASETIRM